MKKKEELFELIKSLDPSEKRYFKRFNTIHSDKKENVTTQLFDLIEKMDDFEEDKIKLFFSDRKTAQHIHVSKNYLYKNILKSLRSFHQGFSKEAEVRDLLFEIELLYHKKLYRQAAKQLSKAFALANKFELQLLKAEIFHWIFRINFMDPETEFEDIDLEQKKEILDSYFLETKLEFLNFRLISFLERKNINNPKDYFLDVPEDQLNSTIIKSDYLFHCTLKALINKDLDSAFHLCDEAIKISENEPEINIEKPGRYFLMISTFVDICIHFNELDKGCQTLYQAESFYNALTNQKAKGISVAFYALYYYKLIFILNKQNKFEDAIASYEEFEKRFPNYNEDFPKHQVVMIYSQLALVYFGNNNAKKSLEVIGNIYNVDSKFIAPSIEDFIDLLSIFCYFELNNPEMLKYKIEVIKLKHKENTQNTILFDFLKIMDKWNKSNTIEGTITNIPTELQNFNFYNWIESHKSN